jgi:hypothetical protein
MDVLRISYNALLHWPEDQARHVRDFLRGRVDLERMVNSVDRGLYRNRKPASNIGNA